MAQTKETLFEITTELQNFLELMDSDDPMDQEAFLDTLEGIKVELGLKADQYAYAIKAGNAKVANYKAMAAYFSEKAKALQNNIDYMNGKLKDAVESVPENAKGKHIVEGKCFRFQIDNNGGKLPLIVDEEKVPDGYKKVILQTDMDRIRAALDAGENLGFAHYGERGTHLSIK